MSFVVGHAQVEVSPTFSGFQKSIGRQVKSIFPAAGKQAGAAFGKSVAEGFGDASADLKKEAENLERKLFSAQDALKRSKAANKAATDAETKALGALRVAELKLQETRDTGKAKASALAAAEENLANKQRTATAATLKREVSERNLIKVNETLAKAQTLSSKASADLETHMKRVSDESTKTETSVNRLSSRLNKAFKGSPLAGVVASIRRDSGNINVDLHKMSEQVAQAGTRGGRAFTQAFILGVGGLSAITPMAGAAGAALLGASGNALTLAASLGSLAGTAALVPAGLMAIGGAVGVLRTAFAGIGEALKTATDQQAAFVANPRLAAMAIEDASRAIQVAEENAARAAEDASRRVASAKQSLKDTIESVAGSEKSAARAIEDATRRVSDAKRSLKETIESVAESEESAAEAVVSATRRVRDAKQNLQDVTERAAEAQKQASRSIEEAQRREESAIRDVISAQKALADARQKASDRAKEAALNQADAERTATATAKDLQQATAEYNKAKADPTTGAGELGWLKRTMEQALSDDQEAKQSVIDLSNERKIAQAEAKSGTEEVLSAQQKLADAQQSAADAAQDRKDAEAKALKQQRDGTRQIADAQQAITNALEDQKDAREDITKVAQQGAQRIADSERDISDALRDQKDARADAAKAARDGARQIADARQAVADATSDAKQTQIDSSRSIEQANRNLERVQMQQADAARQAGYASTEAMNDLTPAAQEAVKALLKVKDQLSGIRKIAQEAFFTGFSGPLLALSSTVMPQLAVGVKSIATALGAGAQQLMESLNKALDNGVLTTLMMGVADTVTALNGAIDPVVQAFVTLGVVGMDYMPRLATAISDIATQFNDFIQASAADGRLAGWIDAGIQGLKDLGSIVSSVVGIFGSLTRAAEAGGAVSTLGGLAEGLRNIDELMKGETFQTTMAKLFSGAEAGSQGLLTALDALGDAFVVGSDAFSDFLRLGGEIAGAFLGGIFTALSNPDFGSGLVTFMEGLQRGVDQIVPLLPGLTGGFGAFLSAMGPIVEQLGPSLVKVFTAFGESLAFIMDVFEPLLVALADSPVILGFLIGAFAATRAASAALTAAGNVQKIAMSLWAAGTWLVTNAMKALNFVMNMNPIMKLVAVIGLLVGAFVWLYKNNETARKIMDAAWSGIKNAVVGTWVKFIRPALSAIVGYVRDVLAPKFVWLAKTVKDIWEYKLKPVFRALGAFFKWVWESVLQPAFVNLKKGFNLLALGLKYYWVNILKPVFKAVGDFFKWVWESVLRPAFGKVRDGFGAFVGGIRSFWENKLKPIFSALGSFIRDKVAPAFEKGVSLIKTAWDKIANFARKPIAFIVDTVYNDGIRKTFNNVADKLKLPDKWRLPAGPEIPGFAGGGFTGPGAKYQEAGVVHKGEYVFTKETTNKLRKSIGLGGLDHINRTGQMPGYSGGGLVRPVKGGTYTGRFGDSRGKYPHAGLDLAVPTGTPVFASMAGEVLKAGWNAITGRTGIGAFLGHDGGRNTYYGHMSKLLVQVGDQVKKGQQIGLSGNTGNSSGPHLHFETWTGGKPVNPEAYLEGASLPSGGGGGGGILGFLQPLFDFKDKMLDGFKAKFPQASMMTEIGVGAAKNAATAVIDWAKSKMPDLTGITDTAGNVLSGVKNFLGIGNVKDQVRGVANGYGWGKGAEWDALSNIISRESGWNPNAANPNSSARGLFQKMTSLHGDIEKTAGDQAGWGLNYIKSRYGDPVKAWAHWQRNGSYSKGGLVEPKLYDNGGWLSPGLQAVANKTGKPEPILTSKQWTDIHSLAAQQMQRGGDNYNISVPKPAATGTDIANAIFHETRVLNRGGRR